MFVIFLDIDGVLLDEEHRPGSDFIKTELQLHYRKNKIPKGKQDYSLTLRQRFAVNYLNEIACDNLNNLITSIEENVDKVGIVISSNWRCGNTPDELKKLFGEQAFSRHIVDKTPDAVYLADSYEYNFTYKNMNLNTSKKRLDRGEEIDTWLQLNKQKFFITNFLILDDIDCSMKRLFKNNFVLVNDYFGLPELIKARRLIACKTPNQGDINSVEIPVIIYNEFNEATRANLNLRITLSSEFNFIPPDIVPTTPRKDFLTFFAKHRMNLPQNCIEIIDEYDGTEQTGSCLIL